MTLDTNNSNKPTLSDQYLVVFILANLIKTLFGSDQKLYQQDDESLLTQFPYWTYKVITAVEPETSDWQELYTVDIQIDCHAKTLFQANNMALKLYRALRNPVYRRFFKQARVIPQVLTSPQDNTLMVGNNYNHDFNFDCRFSVSGGLVWQKEELNFEVQDYDIRSVTAQSDETGEIKANRKDLKGDK